VSASEVSRVNFQETQYLSRTKSRKGVFKRGSSVVIITMDSSPTSPSPIQADQTPSAGPSTLGLLAPPLLKAGLLSDESSADEEEPGEDQRELLRQQEEEDEEEARARAASRNTVDLEATMRKPGTKLLGGVASAEVIAAEPPRLGEEVEGTGAKEKEAVEEVEGERPPPRPPRRRTVQSAPIGQIKRFESTRDLDVKVDETSDVYFANAKNCNRRPPVLEQAGRIQKLRNKTPYPRIAFSNTHLVAGVYSVKVWDLHTGIQVHSISISEGAKVTDVVFCPFQRVARDLTEVWVGLSDGRLLRVDVVRGAILETLAEHQGAISKLVAGDDRLLSLSLDGTLLTWTEREPGVPLKQARTQLISRRARVPQRPKLAVLLGERSTLWIVSYKTISIYEESPAAGYAERHQFVVGPVSSLITCLAKSTDGKFVFTGHADSKIVLWDATLGTQLVAIQMDRTSNSVQAVAGVGNRLWVGLEDGRISVLDAANRMELVKQWQAHKSSITAITPTHDPYSAVVASMSEVGNLHFWDGMLGWDWIDRAIKLREPEFCTFQTIKLAVCSWNVNATKPESLASGELVQWLTTLGDPDIVVIGLQEIVDLENASRNAKSFLREIRSHEDEAGVAWMPAIVDALAQANMEHLLLLQWRQLVGLFMFLIVRNTLKGLVSWGHCTAVKTGLNGLHGNKGAIAMRLLVQDTSICLINSHLPAHHSQVSERNSDAALILKEDLFQPKADDFDRLSFVNGGDGSMALDHEVVVFFGDLNYRINLPNDRARELAAARNWRELYAHDQLNTANNPRSPLRHFSEMRLDFAPTYKYDPGTSTYDTSEKRRIPAWCDRILWKGQHVRPQGYGRLEFTQSDHKPIWGCVEVEVKKVSKVRREPLYLATLAKWEGEVRRHVREVDQHLLSRRTGAALELAGRALDLCQDSMQAALTWLRDPNNVFQMEDQ